MTDTAFVKRANLPENMTAAAAVGDYPEVIEVLRSFGTEVFVLPDNENILLPVRKHADMSLLHLGSGDFLTYSSGAAGFLRAIGANCVIPESGQRSDYPQDIGLNCLILGDKLVCSTRYCAREVLELAEKAGLRPIDVRQGYARCSVAVVDGHSVITSDRAIAQRLAGEGVDVLLIRPGFIELPGFDYGFIGGCCAKLCRHKLLFCGNIDSHPDGGKMREFIESRGVEIICTANHALTDFGGVVQLTERAD